ncbi:MAG: DUF4271 domain-containing protein [Alistipes sp.]|nr:DUF4271 domain-containing protein [Alistipes sp.]
MLEQIEKLQTYGLDTLSEYALRRRVERWTGTLHHPDSLNRNYPAVDGVASDDTFNNIIEQWHRARDRYVDGSVADVLGGNSSLAYDARPLESVASDVADITNINIDNVLPEVADSLGVADAVAVADSMAVVDVPSQLEAVATASEGVGVVGFLGEYWESLTGIGFSLLVIGVFVAYLFCLYRYFDDVVALMHSVFRRGVILSEKVIERRRSEIFYGFLGKLFLLGVAFVGLLSFAWVYSGRGVGVGVEQYTALYALPVSIGVFLAVVVAQSIVMSIIGLVTASFSMVSALIRIRLIYFVLSTVMALPILLVAMMGSGSGYDMWMRAGLCMAGIALLLYARESAELFISKKVSILHWFLYLCAVEILPLSLVWQIAIRLR